MKSFFGITLHLENAMRLTRYLALVFLAVVGPSTATARAQDIPAEYQAVLASLNKKGDFKDGVLKVNIPRATST